MKAAPFREVIPTSGQIIASQGNEATVVAASSGIISFNRNLTEGMQLSKGGELLSISAENLQDGDPVKRARIAYERAKEEYERAEKLIDSRIVSKRNSRSSRKVMRMHAWLMRLYRPAAPEKELQLNRLSPDISKRVW